MHTRNSTFTILFLFRLGCNVRGDAGNGTAQGTCPRDNQVCKHDGTCSGTHDFLKINSINISGCNIYSEISNIFVFDQIKMVMIFFQPPVIVFTKMKKHVKIVGLVVILIPMEI